MWMAYGGRLYACDPLQVEPAVGYENMRLSPEMIEELKGVAKQTATQPTVDISQDRPGQPDTGEEATTVLDPITGLPERADGGSTISRFCVPCRSAAHGHGRGTSDHRATFE